jgi:minor extracellular serine protease Vpr
MSTRSVQNSVNEHAAALRILGTALGFTLLVTAQNITVPPNPRKFTPIRHPKPPASMQNAASTAGRATAGIKSARLDRFALILSDKPVAAQYPSRRRMHSVPAMQAGRNIHAAQATLKSALKTAGGIRVLGSTELLLNAVYVSAPGKTAAQLLQFPGVARVVRMQPVHRNLNLALGLVGVPGAWNVLGGEGNAGTGMKIGIIDTGIDNTNPAFQDPSLSPPSGYPMGAGTNWQNFVNNKIIVARSYVDQLVLPLQPGDTQDLSRPDDLSPRDRVGHGTAAAMIAAGETVNAPLAQITGVAPKAFLGNYKIFGSPGVNDTTFDDVVLMALEDAFNDGMDVVSLSVSSPALWGPDDTGSTCGANSGVACDPRAQAVNNAVASGMTVVCAAGNSGYNGYAPPSYGTIESPGTAEGAITVGAVYNAHIFYQSISVPNGPANLQGIATFFAEGVPIPGGAFTAPMLDVLTIGGSNNPDACAPLPANSLSGAIGLIGTDANCNHQTQAINAQNAGAVAVVFYLPTGNDSIYTLSTVPGVGIPVTMIGNSDALNLESYLSSNPKHEVTLDPTRVETDASSSQDFIAYFSSRGPALETEAIKPEVTAVGTDLYTAGQSYDPNGDMYDPSGFTVVNGTSFAAPMVAGVVAMVQQLHPNLTPSQLKSAVVNTANGSAVGDYDSNGNPVNAGVETTGAGLLNAQAAVQTNVTIEPSTLSFGEIGSGPASQQLTFTNIGTSPVNLSLSNNPYFQDTGYTLSLSQTSFSLAPGAETTITASLQGSNPSPGTDEGEIVVNGASQPLVIPYLDGASDLNIANAFPLTGINFTGAPGDAVNGSLQLEVVDDFGFPQSGVPVYFYPTLGNGAITQGTGTSGTDNYGIAYATAQIGTQLGAQEFAADIGNTGYGPVFTLYFEGRAFALPTIGSGGVVNGASFLQGQGQAPGSYISLFGSGLSETTQLFFTPYLPLSLGRVSVSFDVPSAGLSVPGRLVYVSPGQLDVQVPWELAGQSSAAMKVSIDYDSSNVYTVPITPYSPGFFEYTDSSGAKMLAAQDASYHLIGSANPAHKGATILLYCNGLGPVDTPVPSGEPTPARAPNTTSAPSVTIGGKQAQVVFSGLSPESIGLYQVNVVVPSTVASGSQPVVLEINGYQSQTSTIVVQ